MIKWLKRIGIALVFLLILLGGLSYGIFKSSPFQTFITQKIGNYLSKKSNSTITVQEVDYKLFKVFELNGVLILDHHKDTMAYLGNLGVELNDFDLENNSFEFGNVYLNAPSLNLTTYKGENNSNLNQFINHFKGAPNEELGPAVIIQKSKVSISKGSFKLINYNKDINDSTFNPNNIRINEINFSANNITINDTLYKIDIMKFNGNQKNGGKIHSMEGNFYWKELEFGVENFKLEAQSASMSSNIIIKNPKNKGFEDFISQFKNNIEINHLSIIPSDFAYYFPNLKKYSDRIILQLKATGKLDNLKIKDISGALGDKTSITGNIDLVGLPDIKNTFIFANVDQLNTDFNDVEALFRSFNPNLPLSNLEELKALKDIKFNGQFTGFFENFVAFGEIQSHLGNIRVDTKFEQIDEHEISINGTIDSKVFNIRPFFNTPDLNKAAIKGKIVGNINNGNKTFSFNGTLPLIDYKGYRYKNLKLSGEVKNEIFEGKALLNDEFVEIDFNGGVNWQGNKQTYNFKADVSKFMPRELNLLNRDSGTVVKGKINMNLTGKNFKKLSGNISVDSLNWNEGGKEYIAQKILIQTAEKGGKQLINLNSDWILGKIEGNFNLNQIVPSILNVLSRDLPGIADARFYPNKFNGQNQFRLMFKVKDLTPIHELFLPQLNIPKNAVFSGRFNDLNNFFHLNLRADTLKINNQKLNNFNFYAHNDSNRVNLSLSSDFIEIIDTIGFKNFNLSANTTNNKVNYNVKWDNSKSYKNKVNLSATFDFEKIDSIHHYFTNTKINYKDSVFSINPDNEIIFVRDKIGFKNFKWKGGSQSIEVKGVISKLESDSIKLAFNNFDLTNFDYFVSRSFITAKGNMSGFIKVLAPLNNPLFSADLMLENLEVNNQKFGVVNLKSKYLPEFKKISSTLSIENLSNRLDFKTLFIEGDYFPFDNQKIDLDINVNNLRFGMIEKYTEGLFSNLDRGMATGKLNLNGSIYEPIVTGDLRLDRLNFMIDYLNVDYAINGQYLKFKENEIRIKNFTVSHDKYKNSSAIINGKVNHNYFKDFTFDLDSIKMKSFIALDTKVEDNSLYFGKAFVSGLLSINGDAENTSIKGNIKTVDYVDEFKTKKTTIVLPLDQVDELNVSDFIEFVDLSDTSSQKKSIVNDDDLDLSGLALDFNIGMTNDATVKIVFDPTVDEEIKVKGKGNINLSISPTGNFQMNGDYVISEGDYNFTLKNFISKRFFVKPESQISWNGDPLSANLDIATYYQTRSKLLTLIDSNTVANYDEIKNRMQGRVPVNTNLYLKGDLMKPNITMGINLPEGTAEENEILESQIIGEDEINRQAFALILTGHFLPPQNGLISSVGTGAGIDNSLQFLEGQINNALGGLFNNVDLGLDYNTGDTLSTAELRLLVGFNYRNFRLRTDYDINNNVGDVQVDYKITDELRAKAFHKRTEQNVLDNAMNTVQGIGLLYQKTFDKFGDLWRREQEEP